MSDHILHGNPPIPLTLRRNARARRITLRVSGVDGKVTLTLPTRVKTAEALAFAEEKADWLRSHLENKVDFIRIEHGSELPIRGVQHIVAQGAGRKIAIENGQILVPGPADRVGTRLGASLKAMARDTLAAASDRFAQDLGRAYSRLTLRDTTSRWGSCTAQGGLMYSWRLILAPPTVLDYVAAHEVAHLAEMNHSPAFWTLVQDLYPDYEAPRQWLRTHGSGLHRYRFND